MKLLLVLGSDDNYDIISKSLQPLGFELIRYRHVLKAMDNIDEINPTAILISAKDFPRHWKVLVQFVRSERPIETCPIIILKSANFSNEETSKAFYLGVNGMVDDTMDKPEELDNLQNILSRYVPVHEKRKHHRFFVEPWNRIGFLIANISCKSLVSGTVKTLSSGGISFLPDETMSLEGIALHGELHECSLRIGDAILAPVCRVIHIGRILSLEFISFHKYEQHLLDQYLDEFSLLETKIGKAV